MSLEVDNFSSHAASINIYKTHRLSFHVKQFGINLINRPPKICPWTIRTVWFHLFQDPNVQLNQSKSVSFFKSWESVRKRKKERKKENIENLERLLRETFCSFTHLIQISLQQKLLNYIFILVLTYSIFLKLLH